MDDLERAFHKELQWTYDDAARLGYRATYFIRMVRELGGLETAHRLLTSEDISEGLATLWELGRLDISLEAIVLKPQYAALFSAEERERARARLKGLGGYQAPWDKENAE